MAQELSRAADSTEPIDPADSTDPAGPTGFDAAGRTQVAGVVVAVALAVTNVLSYLLNVIAARSLSPAAFGELGSLLAVLVVGAVPAMGVQTVVALRVAGLGARRPADLDRRDTGPLVTMAAGTAGAVAILLAASTPLIMVLLHLGGPAPVLLVTAAIASITVNGLFYGMLQGTKRFSTLAALIVADGLLRVGGTLTGLLTTGTATGALAGTAVGSLLLAGTGWLLCGRPLPGRPRRALAIDVVHAAQALLGLVLLVNLDLVLARHHLPAAEAGEYAVGSIITKVAYWLPYAIAVVVLPKLADPETRRRVLPLALAFCAGLDALVVLGTAVLGPTIVAVIGGSTYADAAVPLWAFALVGSALSLVQLLLYARIASADRRSTVLVWVAVALEIVLVSFWLHDSRTEVVGAAVIATGTLALAGLVIEFRGRTAPRR